MLFQIPQRYRFSSKSQLANLFIISFAVVLDTTKVQIFKQITTRKLCLNGFFLLFQIPQRYRFSSKSQHLRMHAFFCLRCFRYHKGTDFQANHNLPLYAKQQRQVVLDTTKVQIFKQITTDLPMLILLRRLFQIPQRYRFSSKSQLGIRLNSLGRRCFRYHKGTDFQANHNRY